MAGLMGVLARVPGLGGYAAGAEESQAQQLAQIQRMGALQQIAQRQRALAMESAFRTDLANLGPEATQEQLAQVAAKYAAPGDVMKSQTASADRKAAIEATKAQRESALEQAKSNALMLHEFRMSKLSTDAEKAAESARHNRVMEGIAGMLASIKSDTHGQQKAPMGYRATSEGNLEPIPGGPADTKIQGQLNQDTSSLNSSSAGLDRLQLEAERLLKHPGLSKTTGIMSVVPLAGGIATVPGTDAANFKAGLENLKSQSGLQVLQELRNNSKTGGALGQVSDFENKMLQANLASLDRAQSEPEFKAALEKIVKYTEDAKGRLRNAYNMKHGDRKPTPTPTPSGVQTISSDAEYEALPSGAEFIGPDGVKRKKP